MAAPKARTALLLVHAWVERQPNAQLRARITRTEDIRTPELATTAVASIEEVCEIVRIWLEELLAKAG